MDPPHHHSPSSVSQTEPPLRSPFGWTYRTRLLLREGLLLFTCSFFLHIPPLGDRRKKRKEKKKKPVSRQESIDGAEGRKSGGGETGESVNGRVSWWRGRAVQAWDLPIWSFHLHNTISLKPSPIFFFSIFTSTTGVQTFLYPVILPLIQPPVCCAFSVASDITPCLQAGNPFPRGPDASRLRLRNGEVLYDIPTTWIPAFFLEHKWNVSDWWNLFVRLSQVHNVWWCV